MCLLPLRLRSQWISSLMIQSLFCSTISATLPSSFSVHMRPEGLWGLHQITSFVMGSAALRAKSSKSMLKKPSLLTSGEQESCLPL